jgi:UDP:flavonoid glycosyltransferase YjiC (YdhE family)
MRIAVLAYGSQGDVRPFVALGVGLRAAGHDVRIVTDTGFRPMVEAAGLDYRPVQGDVQAMLKQRNGLSAVTGNPLRALRLMRRLTKELAPLWARDTLAACDGAEALVAGNAAAFMAASIAEKRRLPLIQGWLQPIAPTGAFTSPLVPPMRLSGRVARLDPSAVPPPGLAGRPHRRTRAARPHRPAALEWSEGGMGGAGDGTGLLRRQPHAGAASGGLARDGGNDRLPVP